MKQALLVRLPWIQLSLALHLGAAGTLYLFAAPSPSLTYDESDFVYSVSLLDWEGSDGAGGDDPRARPTDAPPPAAREENGEDQEPSASNESLPANWLPKGGHYNDEPEEAVHVHQWVRVRTGAACPQCQAPLSWWDDCSERDCLQGRGGGHRCDSGSRTELPRARAHKPRGRPAQSRWEMLQKMRERETRKRRRGR